MNTYHPAEFKGMPFRLLPPKEETNNYASYGGTKDLMYGDSHIVSVKVQINGENFFDSTSIRLELKQTINDHHSFELIADPDEFSEGTAYLLKNSRQYLGNRITFQFRQFGQTQSLFTGIITQISSRKVEGIKKIVLTGKSPSILMENGLHCRSFENKTFEEIINKVSSGYAQNLFNFHINPNYKDKLAYTTQYRETDFQFLKRLANRYGEYFFFSGEQFVLSAWGGKITDIIEGEDLFDFELKMKVEPQSFSYTAYDAKQGGEITEDSNLYNFQQSENPFQQHAINASEGLFNVPASDHYDKSLLGESMMEVKRAVERQKRKNQNLIYMEAKTGNPSLRVGDVAKMNAYMPGHETFKSGIVPIESYKIIEITHSFEDGQGYSNTFTGVPKDLTVPFDYDVENCPKAEIQHATVTDNKDPLKMGRVRVQFVWQKQSNTQTPWIQVIQPHAGAGKGSYMNPEINETVLVAFQGGNAEAPIVLGTAYNGGEIAEYYTEGNDIKILQTRSGTKVIMNDAEGSIRIEDPSGNSIFMDGKGNITTKAPETMKFQCKNMEIEVEQDIKTKVGRDIKTVVTQDYSMDTGRNSTIASNRNTYISARSDMDIYGGKKVIGYSSGITEWGAKQRMHVYGATSRITALDKIEYKSPTMEKSPQSGNFNYTCEPTIIDAKWVKADEREIEISDFVIGSEVGILAQTRHYNTGDTIEVEVFDKDNQEIQEGKKTVKLSGQVEKDGTAFLTLQTEETEQQKTEEPTVPNSMSGLDQQAEPFKSKDGKSYTQEQWKEYEQQQWELYAKKNNIPVSQTQTDTPKTKSKFLLD